MPERFKEFRESSLFIVVTIVFPVAAVVATILIYMNSEVLRDQSAQHRIEISSLEGRISEKDSQIILLNEQIKQKSTQAEILKSQVELLQKINIHHSTLHEIDVKDKNDEIAFSISTIKELKRKLLAFQDLKTQFGKAGEIAETISNHRQKIDNLKEENSSLVGRLSVYEPNRPNLAIEEIIEGKSVTLLNGKLTIGLVDSYGSWGYINVSSLSDVLLEREEVRPGKNVTIEVNGTIYILIVNAITQKAVNISLLSGE